MPNPSSPEEQAQLSQKVLAAIEHRFGPINSIRLRRFWSVRPKPLPEMLYMLLLDPAIVLLDPENRQLREDLPTILGTTAEELYSLKSALFENGHSAGAEHVLIDRELEAREEFAAHSCYWVPHPPGRLPMFMPPGHQPAVPVDQFEAHYCDPDNNRNKVLQMIEYANAAKAVFGELMLMTQGDWSLVRNGETLGPIFTVGESYFINPTLSICDAAVEPAVGAIIEGRIFSNNPYRRLSLIFGFMEAKRTGGVDTVSFYLFPRHRDKIESIKILYATQGHFIAFAGEPSADTRPLEPQHLDHVTRGQDAKRTMSFIYSYSMDL
ncbi:MAG TPA: hypothetical protein VMV79_05260 [Alphaproteobacteria bacterium]|nr:hypothetical protein [Alphaproteobacteria bacterium]